MSVQKYKEFFYEAVQDLLWRQWTALGIPGQIHVVGSEKILDPEALLVFSAGFARYDQRLYDMILEWLQIHSSQINLQRLKAITAKVQWKDIHSLGYMASVVSQNDPSRWAKAAQDYIGPGKTSSTPLFQNQNGEKETFIPHKDSLALHCGFLRNEWRNSKKTSSLLPETDATLVLRMRGLFGISARVEALLVLLDLSPCKVQDIVDYSGFTWKSIQDVLEELGASGFVSSTQGDKRGKLYFLSSPQKLRNLFGIRNPALTNWISLYDTIGLVSDLLNTPQLQDLSKETIQGELQAIHERTILRTLRPNHNPLLQKLTSNLSNFPHIIQHI